MAMKTKKIDVKKVAKVDLSKALLEFLRDAGYEVEDGVSRGFTRGFSGCGYCRDRRSD